MAGAGWQTYAWILSVALVVPELSLAAPKVGVEAPPTVASAETQPVLLAQSKKKRKKGKKKRKKGGEEATDGEAAEAGAQEGAAAGSGLHAAQAGAEEPYKWQVSLLSDFAINNEQTGDAKTGTADYDLSTKIGYIIAQSFIVGGGLDFAESSYKTEEDTNTSRSYVLRFFGDYVFGNIDTDQMLFFAGLGFGIGSSSSKSGDVESKGSSTQFGIDFGMHYFVDSNVAFTGEFVFDTGSRKVDGQDDPTKFTSIHIARLGFSLFL